MCGKAWTLRSGKLVRPKYHIGRLCSEHFFWCAIELFGCELLEDCEKGLFGRKRCIQKFISLAKLHLLLFCQTYTEI